METIVTSQTISEVIQLAVAPVFLLVAVGSFLNVMTQRLARVVDRARALEAIIIADTEDAEHAMRREELSALDKRMTYAQRAITFSAIAALLIAFLVALIFLSDLAGFNTAQLIAVLFILSMSAVTTSLCFFLAEVAVATRTLRVRAELLAQK